VRLSEHGAVVVDELTGQRLELRARAVLNATGAWADTLTSGAPPLRPSKGVHVVLAAATLGHPAASMTVPVPGQPNRFVFALPHPDGIVHVGLTDDPVDGPLPDVPTAQPAEEVFLLDVLSRGLERPLSRADVVGRFAGVRPLIAGEQGRTADLSRRHAVVRGDDGVITVLGGKLTTYRQMAEDAVDRVCAELGQEAPCRTRDLPLVGAGPAPAGVPVRLVRRYGTEAADVAALAARRPELLEPVADGVPVLGVELAWGVVAEGALTPEDLLERRTRVSLVDAWHDAARPAAQEALSALVA
jgi:glycerol-3-phosphate dehydrogenase